MEKLISSARNQPDNPLDERWSLGYLAEHEIPPEALPAIVQLMRKRLPDAEVDLTIRQVMWIVRLHKLFDDLMLLRGAKPEVISEAPEHGSAAFTMGRLFPYN